jgi:3-deoxy-D-manno-octulosonate 8-phosphate phosphatase (KDO 8-P phosphatase)
MFVLPDNINLIAYDFDGVMTDNKVYVDQNGNEMVQVNRADGLGISEIKKLGIEQIIISTEKNPVVSARAKKLKIKCFQNIDDKREFLIDYCNNKFDLNKVIFVGNDTNDEEVMGIVGVSLCPSDAVNRIKKKSDYIFTSKGGEGVARELLSLIKKKRN